MSYEYSRANKSDMVLCNLNTIYIQSHTMYSLKGYISKYISSYCIEVGFQLFSHFYMFFYKWYCCYNKKIQ